MHEYYTRALLTGTRDAGGAFPKRYRFRATSDIQASDGLTIPANAWSIDRYLSNPIVLAAHNKLGLSIGKATEVVLHAHGIDAEIEFDEDDPLARDIMRKLDRGYMNAVSVSFSVDEMASRNVVGRADLLEISVVALPADPTALMMRAVAEGIQAGAERIASPTTDPESTDRIARLEERIATLEAQVREASEGDDAPEATDDVLAVDIDLSRFPNLIRS